MSLNSKLYSPEEPHESAMKGNCNLDHHMQLIKLSLVPVLVRGDFNFTPALWLFNSSNRAAITALALAIQQPYSGAGDRVFIVRAASKGAIIIAPSRWSSSITRGRQWISSKGRWCGWSWFIIEAPRVLVSAPYYYIFDEKAQSPRNKIELIFKGRMICRSYSRWTIVEDLRIINMKFTKRKG